MGDLGRAPFNQAFRSKTHGSVRSNRKSFEKTGPPFEVVLCSRSDRLEFGLNGSRPRSLKGTFFSTRSCLSRSAMRIRPNYATAAAPKYNSYWLPVVSIVQTILYGSLLFKNGVP